MGITYILLEITKDYGHFKSKDFEMIGIFTMGNPLTKKQLELKVKEIYPNGEILKSTSVVRAMGDFCVELASDLTDGDIIDQEDLFKVNTLLTYATRDSQKNGFYLESNKNKILSRFGL